MGSLDLVRECKALSKSAQQAQEPRICLVKPLTGGVNQRNTEPVRSPVGNCRGARDTLRAVHDDVKRCGVRVKLHHKFVDSPSVRKRGGVFVGLTAILEVLARRWLVCP